MLGDHAQAFGEDAAGSAAGVATWWHLDDRFALHGMALRLLDDVHEDAGEFLRALFGSCCPKSLMVSDRPLTVSLGNYVDTQKPTAKSMLQGESLR